MKYYVVRQDHVRWRSESMEEEITSAPKMSTFIEFGGRVTALLGWDADDKSTGKSLNIKLERAEAEALYGLLGERLGLA